MIGNALVVLGRLRSGSDAFGGYAVSKNEMTLRVVHVPQVVIKMPDELFRQNSLIALPGFPGDLFPANALRRLPQQSAR